MNREKMKSTLFEALHGAGALMARAIHESKRVEKKSELSLVTETDKAAEKLIVEVIGRNFPDHAILTEESPPMGDSPARWIIDPVDGTTNFSHAFPVACVSIGFELEGRVEMGGVYDPFREELFFAARGEGATLNGKPIRVSTAPSLADSLLATGFPYDRRERPDDYLAIFRAFMMKTQGLRRMGAAAIDLCYVACGRFDGFWEVKLQPWDKAASMVIIEEAGGRLSDFSGNPLGIDEVQNLASNGRIHDELLETLTPFRDFR